MKSIVALVQNNVIDGEPGVPDQSSRQRNSKHVLFDTTRTKIHFNRKLCKMIR